MTIAGEIDRIPEWTRGDRLRKARSLTKMNTREFAAEIGVSQKTVTDAEGDKRAVRRITINAWSLATGVPREWLENGTVGSGPDSGGRQITHEYPWQNPTIRARNGVVKPLRKGLSSEAPLAA